MAKFLGNFCREIFKYYPSQSKFSRNLFRRTQPKETSDLDNYIFVQPVKEEFNQIYKLLEDHFFPEEPAFKAIEYGNAYHPVLEKEVYETLEFGYSYIAKCKWSGCIIGACLNFSTSDLYPDNLRRYACQIKDEKVKELLLFYAYIQEAPGLFDRYCESEAFVIRAVAVDKDNRNYRVGSELVRKSRKLGKDLSFPIIRCDCSNNSLCHICERLGMDLEYETKFCEYIGKNLKPVFDTLPPNNSVITYLDLPLRISKRGRSKPI